MSGVCAVELHRLQSLGSMLNLPHGVIPAKAGNQWDLSASAGDAASH